VLSLLIIPQSRTLSSAAAQATVKPPIQVFGLEGRYATALYSAASKLSQLDQVEKDLTALQATIRSDKKLREHVTSPIINKKVMATALKEAAEKLRFAPATANLLGLLADNGRLKRLDTVINAYKTIMAAHTNWRWRSSRTLNRATASTSTSTRILTSRTRLARVHQHAHQVEGGKEPAQTSADEALRQQEASQAGRRPRRWKHNRSRRQQRGGVGGAGAD